MVRRHPGSPLPHPRPRRVKGRVWILLCCGLRRAVGEDLPAAVYARVDRSYSGMLQDCQAIGYPLFQYAGSGRGYSGAARDDLPDRTCRLGSSGAAGTVAVDRAPPPQDESTPLRHLPRPGVDCLVRSSFTVVGRWGWWSNTISGRGHRRSNWPRSTNSRKPRPAQTVLPR